MSEEFFYHYTTYEGATAILGTGRILPSRTGNGDAIHGDGVYLTTLDPGLGREAIKYNNWDGLNINVEEKTEYYFEILIPSNRVRRALARRDIQVYSGALRLAEYKWSLKHWHGDLVATQHFMVSSQCEAAMYYEYVMGRYTLVKNMVMNGDCAVYKQDEGDHFLYANCEGQWCVGEVAGSSMCVLFQPCDGDDLYPSPHKTVPWLYSDLEEMGWVEDVTLRVFPCY